jgi:hypothetical protein
LLISFLLEGIHSINIRKHYVENCITIREQITRSIQEANNYYDVPFLSISLDLIQNAVQNKKLFSVRVSYALGASLVSWNLAVCGYTLMEDNVQGERASNLLVDWMKMILEEFKIDAEDHVLTSCTDSESDVKRALDVAFSTIREWCVSHLLYLALADAFGSHVDPNKTKNSEVCELLNSCRKVIETVNKSKLLKFKVDNKMMRESGIVTKLKNSPANRWSAMEDVLIRLLKHWNILTNTFNECQCEFAIKHDRKVLLELQSVIHPVQHIQRVKQRTKEFVVFQVYLLLMHLYFSHLNPLTPLKIYDPSLTLELGPRNGDSGNPLDRLAPSSRVPPNELDPRTTKVREKLYDAVLERYFKRYHAVKAYHKGTKADSEKKDF